MASENLNVAIFTLANNFGFILQGGLLILGLLYFYRYRGIDGVVLQCAVAMCLVLETLATGFNLSYGWKTTKGIGISQIHWEPPFSMVVRIPVMAISQTFFFYRAYRIFNSPRILMAAWSVAITAEVATGEANFLVTVIQRTIQNTKPISTVDLLTSHLVIVTALDLITATAFIWKLRSLKSSIKRSDQVIQQIVFQTVVSNLCFSAFSLTILLTWILVLSAKWYKIPMELGYRSYALSFLVALLTRDSIRSQLDRPLRSLQFPIDLNSDHSSRIQHHSPGFIEESNQSSYWNTRKRRSTLSSIKESINIDQGIGNVGIIHGGREEKSWENQILDHMNDSIENEKIQKPFTIASSLETSRGNQTISRPINSRRIKRDSNSSEITIECNPKLSPIISSNQVTPSKEIQILPK